MAKVLPHTEQNQVYCNISFVTLTGVSGGRVNDRENPETEEQINLAKKKSFDLQLSKGDSDGRI